MSVISTSAHGTEDRLLTPAEAASMIGVKPSTMQYYRKRHRGPRWVRINSKVVKYKLSDILHYIESEDSQS